MNWLAINITYLTARFREKTRLLLWHYGKLFIPLTSSKVLALGKAKMKKLRIFFCFPLTYSYL